MMNKKQNTKKFRYIYLCILPDGRVYCGKRTCRKKINPMDDNYFGSGLLIRRYIEKHGSKNIKKIILHQGFFTDSQLNKLEIKCIAEIREKYKEKCINILDGGEGGNPYRTYTKKQMNRMRRKIGDKTKEGLSKMTKKEIETMCEHRSKGIKDMWKKMSSDEKQKRNQKSIKAMHDKIKWLRENDPTWVEKTNKGQRGENNGCYGKTSYLNLKTGHIEFFKKNDPGIPSYCISTKELDDYILNFIISKGINKKLKIDKLASMFFCSPKKIAKILYKNIELFELCFWRIK